MKREILFRGIRTDGGGWVEGVPLKNKIGTFIITEKNPHFCHDYGYIEINEFEPVIPETVGQFIRTINNQKVFDGDMFIQINHPETVHKIKIIDGEPTVWQKVVIQGVHDWMRDRVGLSVFAKAWQDTFQIIGTIHDNKEATP